MMKVTKRTILIFLIMLTLSFLFRGVLYRQLITYKSIGLRTNYIASDDKLTKYIDTYIVEQTNHDIEIIIKLGLSITSKRLNFTVNKNDNDPNKLVISRTAHCVGYASFFATTCNYLLKKYNLSDEWIAKPQIGQIYFFKINIHKYFNSSFFKDHDFATIENKKTGKTFAVDPTLNDYLNIDFINFQNDKLRR